MDKLKMQTVNKADENFKKLAAMFPNAVTEIIDENGEVVRAIDKDVLMQEISCEVVEGNEERYQFTWPDKKKSVLLANAPINKTLRPVRDDETIPTGVDSDGKPYCSSGSVDFDNTENLYIEGDNLEVLKLLQETYLGKIKMIYIDPPYNTGNDFVYADDFSQSTEEYLENSGQFDDEGNRLVKNLDNNGRFHTDWLNMLYPRLKLAKDLLAEDGVIFISIDDNEVTNLRRVCNEVLGESNFIAQFIWQSRQNKDNRNISGVSIDHEYIICYSKQCGQRIFRGTERKTELYNNPDDDPRGPWTSANMVGLATKDARPNLHYDLINPYDGINYGCPTKGWRYDRNTMKRLIDENRIIWPDSPTGRPRKKSFLFELSDNLPGYSSVFSSGVYTNTATKELASIFDGYLFDFPKPVEIIRQLIQQVTAPEDIILDFFSGSATTAHAVMQLNYEDKGHRKFIMVQLPEACDAKSEAYRAGYKNICEIGKERIRRAGAEIQQDRAIEIGTHKHEWNQTCYYVEHKEECDKLGHLPDEYFEKEFPPVDTGFRVLKLDDTNMKDVYYAPDDYDQGMLAGLESNIKDDRTDLDLLFGCLIDWGLPLSLPYKSEQLGGCTVHTYNDGDLIACFDKNIPESVVKEIAQRKPLRAVFRDSGFASSPEKINVFEIFKLYMPEDAGDISKRVRVI